MQFTQLLGCDFSSSPNRRKPIVIARGQRIDERCIQLQQLVEFDSLDTWQRWLADAEHGPWVGGFDLPFGLPRELVQALGWPMEWAACMDFYASLSRVQIREQFKSFCDARPAGGKFAHRATDLPAGSSPSMKWVNPPVAYMLHAGLPRLRAAGVHLPGLEPLKPQAQRVALEAYPGLLARAVLGRRSYKSDDASKQTTARADARTLLLQALEQGDAGGLGLRLQLDEVQRSRLLADGKGDALDAVLCLMQSGWAACRRQAGDSLYGLPPDMDALEGWIVTAGTPLPKGTKS
ncbi:MAG: DUF429 domain-containing protein [Comamonas sp.]|jgi:hypothetical protein|uniref:DUF429 domain-containing protein n=1 Tax=Comamonas sp. TaxID=34028 RepID=UPI00282B8DB8|nr:DUF429 domain-containing protein [Comamonas sp.]MDR0213664.1 DUF429 domain-containing protein [Comamonas sp.]